MRSDDEFLGILDRPSAGSALASAVRRATQLGQRSEDDPAAGSRAAGRRRCEFRHVSVSGRQQLRPAASAAGGAGRRPARIAGAAADPDGREALRALVEKGSPDPHAAQSKVVLIGWGNVRISGTSNPELKRFEGKSMEDAAAEAGITPFDLMVRFIEEDAGQTAIVMFQLDDDDLRAACTHCLHMFGSDGLPRPGTKPHPRAYGTFPRVAGRLGATGLVFAGGCGAPDDINGRSTVQSQ